MVCFLLCQGQRKAKGGAMTRLTRYLDLSSLHLHQHPCDRQAKTCSTDCLRHGVVCPIEASEEPSLLLCGQPNARIRDCRAGYRSNGLHRKVNLSFLRSIFVRIREQIGENLLHPVAISEDHESWLRQMQSERLSLGLPAELKRGDEFLDEVIEIERFLAPFDRARFKMGEIQQVISEAQHPESLVPDNEERVPLLFCKTSRRFLCQEQ